MFSERDSIELLLYYSLHKYNGITTSKAINETSIESKSIQTDLNSYTHTDTIQSLLALMNAVSVFRMSVSKLS